MKNSTKFWLILLCIILLVLTITFPSCMFTVFWIGTIATIVVYILLSIIFYDHDETWGNYKWHIFKQYNLICLIHQFNEWLNEQDFNNPFNK